MPAEQGDDTGRKELEAVEELRELGLAAGKDRHPRANAHLGERVHLVRIEISRRGADGDVAAGREPLDDAPDAVVRTLVRPGGGGGRPSTKQSGGGGGWC